MLDAVITDPTDAFKYVTAGRGKFTLVSKRTGTRYTYKANRGEKQPYSDPLVFIKVLTGPDNQTSYTYVGFIRPGSVGLKPGKKGQPTAVTYRALDWALRQFASGVMPEELELWHSGTCGCCGRELTVPASIASGFGPVCARRQK